MKKRLLASAACVLVFGGCAQFKFTGPDPTRPQVIVSPAGYLVVDQEPIAVAREPGKEATITWRLSPTGTVRFEERGIVIEGMVKTGPKEGQRKLPAPETSQNRLFRCTTSEDRLTAACRLSPEIKPGFYAYTINARDGARRIVLDPTIMVE
jgi:hypothetical protein